MATPDQILRSNLSAFLQYPQLVGNLTQSTNDFLVPPRKTEYDIGNSNVAAEFLDIRLRPAQVMPREARRKDGAPPGN